MDVNESQAILSALSPEVLAERQRIVDLAVREAREVGYCEETNRMLQRILPEFVLYNEDNGYSYAFDSDGVDCKGYTVAQRFDARGFEDDGNGYDRNGYDRDGYDRAGYGTDGYDSEGRGRTYWRDRRWWKYADGGKVLCDATDPERYDRERVYLTGYGTTTYLDAEGHHRVGRPATPEEVEAEESLELYNPTTWSPATVTVG